MHQSLYVFWLCWKEERNQQVHTLAAMAHLALVGESKLLIFRIWGKTPVTILLIFRATRCLGKSRGPEESDCGEVDQEAGGDAPQPRVSIIQYCGDQSSVENLLRKETQISFYVILQGLSWDVSETHRLDPNKWCRVLTVGQIFNFCRYSSVTFETEIENICLAMQ